MRISPQSYCGAVSAVESQVVGYVTTANCKAGQLYLIAQNFQNVDGSNVNIQDFISSTDMIGGYDDDSSPNIKVWTGSGFYDYYYYAEDLLMNENVWCDGGMMVEDVTIDLAQGVFFKSANDCTISVAGMVVPGDEMLVPLQPGVLNLVANPFPTKIDINGEKVDWTGSLVGGYDDDSSPNLKVWTGNGYYDYFFYTEDLLMNENVWCDGGMAVEGVYINPCQGFFLKYDEPATAVNLKFIK